MGKPKKEIGKIVGQSAPEFDRQRQLRSEWLIEYYTRHYDLSNEQVVGLSKWLTASLFAANSGGVLTILNQADKLENPHWAGLAFILGLVFALLSAAANQEVYNRAGSAIVDLIGYWQNVKITGTENEAQQRELETALERKFRFAWAGPTLGWISGIAFIVGASLVALGII